MKKFDDIQQSSVHESEEVTIFLDSLTQKRDILKDLNEKILDWTTDEEITEEIQDSDEYMYNRKSVKLEK